MPTDAPIPLDVANPVLATFGITKASELYNRRVKADGFSLDDLHEVLAAESRFIFLVNWRSALPEELEPIIAALEELGADVESEVADDAEEGWLECDGNRAFVKYIPNDNDDFTAVVAALQQIIPSTIEFRESPHNYGNDTWEFAVLLREEWAALETLHPALIQKRYRPITVGPRA